MCFNHSFTRNVTGVFLGCTLPVFFLFCSSPASALDSVLDNYKKIEVQITLDSVKRHLDYANALEDRWIYSQAVKQFKLANEYSIPELGKLSYHASRAYGAMRGLQPTFIKKHYHDPSRKERKAYRTRAAAEDRRDRKGWKRLADYAASHPDKLLQEALAGYRRLIRGCHDLLAIDDQGRIVLPEGTIDESISTLLCEEEGTVPINDQLYLQSTYFKVLLHVDEVCMVANKNIRLLTQNKELKTEELLDLVEDFCKVMKSELGDTPDTLLTVFVFDDRSDYESYCQSSANSFHKAGNSFTSFSQETSVVCLQNSAGNALEPEEVWGSLIRELSILYQYRITRTIMPAWYRFGLAECYGGPGSFQWTKGRLKIHGKRNPAQLISLLGPGKGLDFDSFLFSHEQIFLTKEEDRRRFNSQSWAFLRYMEKGVGAKTTRLFRNWIEECYSKELSTEAARTLFQAQFLKCLPTLRDKFPAYLEKLAAKK